VERKIGSGKKCALSSSKVRAALKKQTAGRSAKSYRKLGRKIQEIQVHHNTVKKSSESGISEPVYFKAGLPVNKEVYIFKCLPVLHTFIQKHHKNEKIVFWLDLASAHYAGYVGPIRRTKN
jgi:hypothetical protein